MYLKNKDFYDIRWEEIIDLGTEVIGLQYAPCSKLKNNRCTIYNTRPQRCRNYPTAIDKAAKYRCCLRKEYKGEN